ncbi:hypothetical protein [Sideroxyarcus emersonii]|uniref:hypothetical protein n=1 Tax=Sideroxyarcus emersonii TaxID=2764705 RepID=UPI001F39539B|nr:hypothetical protein [Sideroxyarcus emersonii]
MSVQHGPLGHPLDDVIVEGEGADGVSIRLSLQVKRSITISAAATNTDFRDTVLRAHATATGAGFHVRLDRVGIATGEISEGSKRDFETLCEWARSEHDTAQFRTKLHTDGVAGKKQTFFDAVRGILSTKLPEGELDAATHSLLSHFVLIRFDLMHEGSVTEPQTVASLANHLQPSERSRADDLWRRLLALVRVAEGHAASFDRKTLVARLNGAFRLAGAPSLKEALARIGTEARHAANEIPNDIGGVSISRGRFVQSSRTALTQHRFVQIGGLPGTGKSVVLRTLVEEALKDGPVLFLKADRLNGVTWSQYSTSQGIGPTPLGDLLVELASVGTPVVFVDGLDRIDAHHRGILTDIFNTILDSDLLANWKVVATVRDTGIEPVRTWLPRKLLVVGAAVIDVAGFDDDEAASLAQSKPALKPLLFGTEQVRAIVRRPFFAGVLIRRHPADTNAPSSEIELATAWWTGGGYGADPTRAGHRRIVLVELARRGAPTLGKRIQILGVDPQVLVELEADGIIRQVRAGHTVDFVHDIYFEWSFLQLLVSQGGQWLDVIRQVGEPPILGRTVELFSQSELKDGNDWQGFLERLESATDVRSQWLRAWMVGPFGLSSFQNYEQTYNAAMFAEGARRVAKLVVWFQAEKTKANPNILGNGALPDLGLIERIRLADSMAWPSDMSTWARFNSWLIRWIHNIPTSTLPDVVAVFEVWQNAFADLVNPVSKEIVRLAGLWLADIEAREQDGTQANSRTGWDRLRHGELEELGERLRAVILRAGRAYRTPVREHLSHLMTLEYLPRQAVEQVMTYAFIISEVCPDQLVDFMLSIMIRPLPEEVVRRSSDSPFGIGISSHDWQSLSIDDQHGFFPCAPTREPFPSLFAHAPDEARRLVREITNHAITAWRQLHVYDYEERGTPIPLTLDFPWGQQTFWGGAQQYVWSRGTWGSHAVGSGLMALELWALKEVENGRPVDDVIRDVLEGHESVAALGVAIAVMLESKHISEVTLPLLTSQRLWDWDIQRHTSDLGFNVNLMGFLPHDRRHYQAVVEGNERRGRRMDVRDLASMCVIGGGDLGTRTSEAIIRFTDDLPFGYAEQRENPETVRQLRRTAEIWAEVGRRTNYRATPTENGDGLIIQLDNPVAQGPDIDAINQRQAEMAEHLPLLNWANATFQNGVLNNALTLEQAVERARRLDSADLFEEAFEHVSPGHERQAAVSCVAAVALRYGRALPLADLDWSTDVCLRAWRTREVRDDMFFSGSILLNHPTLFATYGLAAMDNHDPTRRDALEALIQLAGHPYEQIMVEALAGLLALWGLCPEVAWLALELAASLSIFERPSYDTPREQIEEQIQRGIWEKVATALSRLDALDEPPHPLPGMPPAWVPATNGRRIARGRRGREVIIEWEHPSTDVHTQFLAKVLTKIPADSAMGDVPRRDQFLTWCDGLVGWTIERIHPSWARQEGGQDFEAASSEHYEWRRDLFRFFARVSLHLDPDESARRFVEPAAGTNDDTFGSLMSSYVSYITHTIMDEPVFPTNLIVLLEKIVPRVLAHRRWEQSRWNDGEIHDSDLYSMIRALFFIDVERAMGAARFANGDWTDVTNINSVIDPILAAQGQNPTVISSYLTLCERAYQAYPLELFVAKLPMVLGGGGGMPLGWRGTTVPARLAGIIQLFSEKVHPLSEEMARALLRALDALVDMGDRRAAAIQTSEAFKDVRTVTVVV